MKRFSKQLRKASAKTEMKNPSVSAKNSERLSKSFLKSTGKMAAFTKKATRDIGEMAASWADQQIPRAYALLSNAISSSKAIAAPTSKAILEYISTVYESSSETGKRVINHTAIFVNAILASDFSNNMEKWFDKMFHEGIPSIYDKAVDAVYNATHIGGGHLHRLFDGSHTLWGMWDKVCDASPDDTFLQEVVGYATALGKDLSSKVGIPIFDWSKSSYDQVTGVLSTSFDIPNHWFQDLLHVNAPELLGTSIGAIAVALNWDKKQVKEFASLAGSLGISSIANANPALAVVTLATLARSFIDAKQKRNYSEFVKGLAKGGVGTGAFLATASAIGGPVWIGVLAGTCVGVVVHKTMDSIEISQITTFMETSLRKAGAQLKAYEQTQPDTL